MESNVVDMARFRQKRETERELTEGRDPLYMTHLKGSPYLNREPEGDFADRMNRIRESLEKINDLMGKFKSGPPKS